MSARELHAARIRRFGQIVLGAIWLIDGALQFQPVMFGRTFITGVILPNADGQPGLVAAPITWLAHNIDPHVALFNGLAAALQVAIGLALLWTPAVRPALAVSFVWAAMLWFAGEGLGGLLTGAADPLTGAPGAALLYIVVGAMVWPRRRVGGIGARVAWAGLWLSCAALWLLPANRAAGSVHDAIAGAPSGAGWLTSLLNGAARATQGQGTAIALTLATLSIAIAVSALTGRAEHIFLWLGIGLSAAFWAFGQGFGGILTGSATDVSTAPLVILMGGLLLAQTTVLGPDRVMVRPPLRLSYRGRPSSPTAA